MLKSGAKIVVVYLLWSNEPRAYLERALLAMEKQTYSKELVEFLIIYNSHKPDEQSQCPYIREEVAKHSATLPHVTIIEQEKNLGFSGGNNFGMKWAIDNGFDYVFLHNGDGYLDSQCVEKLVSAMESDKKIGASQALVLLHPENELINTSGNNLHYLGFGYCGNYRKNKNEVGLSKAEEIGYASGAAVILRVDLLKQHGLWDEDFFMYHEDTDYSLRLRLLGYKIVSVSDARFFHEYHFSKNKSKYFWLERNRLALLLVYYKLPTLILLWPLKIFLELGLLVQSLKQGWIKEWWQSRLYWAHISSWRLWFGKRKIIQKNRKISDRDLLKTMVPEIIFSEESVTNPVLKYIGNPVMQIYYLLLRIIVWW